MMYYKSINLGIICFLLLPLLCACSNPADSPEETMKPSKGTIQLIIKDNRHEDSPRTLTPTEPVFSAYRLCFTPLDGQESKADAVIPADGTGVIRDIALDPGNWTITAYGSVLFEGQDREVAEGTSAVFAVETNGNIDVLVTIQSTDLSAGPGKFAWSLTIPQHTQADSYTITLSEWDRQDTHRTLSTGTLDTSAADVTITGEVLCEQGYYFLRVSMGTARQQVFYDDVVHINTYKMTNLEYNINTGAFVPVLMVSGSVQVSLKFNGDPVPSPEIQEVWVYTGTGEKIGYTEVIHNQWRMALVKSQEIRDLYFRVVIKIENTYQELQTEASRQVYQDDIDAIDLICNADLISLSGSVMPYTAESITLGDWQVRAYTDPAQREASLLRELPVITDVNGNWSMIINAFEVPADVYFSITKRVSGKTYQRIGLHKLRLSHTHIQSIVLTGYFIPPKQVWIRGTLPDMNWNASKELSRSVMDPQSPCYQFTLTKSGLEDRVYGVQILASFTGGVSNPDWNTLNSTNVRYGYPEVLKLAGGAGMDYYRDSEDIAWLHIQEWRGYHHKTLIITLDFSGDTYLETGKPVLKIERRKEVLIPPASLAGSFQMGSPSSEKGRNGPEGLNGLSSETRHGVTITQFYMMPTEVPQELYEELMPRPVYKHTDGYNFQKSDYPAVNISWLDAAVFANKLSERDGLPQVYTINGETVTANWNSYGWRLPTEAEWEFAARADSATPFAPPKSTAGYGNTLHTDIANYNGSVTDPAFGYNPTAGTYRGHIIEVDSFFPNAWDLFNMHGNVWEFCWDWYADYNAAQVNNPHGYDSAEGGWENGKGNGTGGFSPASKGKRIIRGGSYYCSARYLRSAHRGVINPRDASNNDIGFRLVRNVP